MLKKNGLCILKGIFKRIIVLLVIYYGILPLVMPSMIYIPQKGKTEINLNVRNVYFNSGREKLKGWFIKAKQDKPTIIFCHGNGGNITHYSDIISHLSENGYGVFMFDYRGYGESSGTPEEQGLYQDLNSAINYLKNKEHISNNQIVLWGLSLGGAVVSEIASKENFKGIILQSTFTNIKEEAIALLEKKHSNKFIRVFGRAFYENFLLFQNYDTRSKISKISSPLLIAHSKSDEMIPVKMSYTLAKLNPNAELFVSEQGGHNENYWIYDKAFEFLNSLDK